MNGIQVEFFPKDFSDNLDIFSNQGNLLSHSALEALNLAEFLKIFADSFHMAIEVYDECLESMESQIDNVASSAEFCNRLRSIRPLTAFTNESCYLLRLLSDNSEIDFTASVGKILNYTSSSPQFGILFYQAVETSILNFNEKTEAALKQKEYFTDLLTLEACIELYLAILYMYLSALSLQKIMESIMGKEVCLTILTNILDSNERD